MEGQSTQLSPRTCRIHTIVSPQARLASFPLVGVRGHRTTTPFLVCGSAVLLQASKVLLSPMMLLGEGPA